MDELKSSSLINSQLDRRLQLVANVLFLNASFTDKLGLANGKMDIGLFIYHYKLCIKSKSFEEQAGELIEGIPDLFTKRRKLMERLFDNLKYIANKK